MTKTEFIQKIYAGEFDDMTCGELAEKYPEFKMTVFVNKDGYRLEIQKKEVTE